MYNFKISDSRHPHYIIDSKFYHADALGSTRGITDSTQAATDSILYDAFGNTVSRSGSTLTPFAFVGAQQYQSDSDSGLQLLGHRYYDPSIGRFISSDPAKAGTNWYAYCGNNPLNQSDPLGLDYWGQVGQFALGELKAVGDAIVSTGISFLPGGKYLPRQITHPFDPGSPVPGDNEDQQDGYKFGSGLITIASIVALYADGGSGGGAGSGGGIGQTGGGESPRPSGPPHSWHYSQSPPEAFTGGLNSGSYTTPQAPTGNYFDPIYVGSKLGIPPPQYAYPIYPAPGDIVTGPTPISASNPYPWAGSTGEKEYFWPGGTSAGTVGRPIRLF